MKSNKKADSIAWVITAVFILSFILLWIVSMIWYNNDVTAELENQYKEFNLESNINNLSKKLNTQEVKTWEIFYINKTSEWNFEILTWSWNENYKYIDNSLNNIDPDNFEWDKYELYFNKDQEILRTDLKPEQIKNPVFNFDGFDMNWDWNIWSNYNQNQAINSWTDTISWINAESTNWPIFTNTWINSHSWAIFNWSNNLNIPENSQINNSEFEEKSFAIIFKTGENIDDLQYIYKQWNENIWYAIQINSQKLYAWAWNNSWQPWDTYKISNTKISKNTTYKLIINQNSWWVLSENKISFYLNWIKFNELNNIWVQSSHSWSISIWSSQWWSIDLSNNSAINTSDTYYFEWTIWEISSWNKYLTPNEINWVNNYLQNKWILNKKNIEYNWVNTFLKKIN